ncbi:MAG: nuclear transport factor 2 family protein [Chitinophagaceae bacterium]|nr:nuclear transport factor 2 family protein [Chitinophagaceae bacterium]
MGKLLSFLFAILFSAMLMAQQPLNSSQQAVQETVIKMFDALSNRDSVSLKLYCADDITLYEYGQTWNLDTLINKAIRLNTATDFKRINTINFINTTINKQTAWATYNNQADITMNGKLITKKWLETVVLVKEEKRWKIKVLHSTPIK